MIVTTDAGTIHAEFNGELVIVNSDDRFALEVVVSGLELSGAALSDGEESTEVTYSDEHIFEYEAQPGTYFLQMRPEDFALYLQHEVLNFLT